MRAIVVSASTDETYTQALTDIRATRRAAGSLRTEPTSATNTENGETTAVHSSKSLIEIILRASHTTEPRQFDYELTTSGLEPDQEQQSDTGSSDCEAGCIVGIIIGVLVLLGICGYAVSDMEKNEVSPEPDDSIYAIVKVK